MRNNPNPEEEIFPAVDVDELFVALVSNERTTRQKDLVRRFMLQAEFLQDDDGQVVIYTGFSDVDQA